MSGAGTLTTICVVQKTLYSGVFGVENIEGALKTVDLEKILSHLYLGKTFLKLYNEFLP
jgi:hypothetical protein